MLPACKRLAGFPLTPQHHPRLPDPAFRQQMAAEGIKELARITVARKILSS